MDQLASFCKQLTRRDDAHCHEAFETATHLTAPEIDAIV
jgi:hypothetical protein